MASKLVLDTRLQSIANVAENLKADVEGRLEVIGCRILCDTIDCHECGGEIF